GSRGTPAVWMRNHCADRATGRNRSTPSTSARRMGGHLNRRSPPRRNGGQRRRSEASDRNLTGAERTIGRLEVLERFVFGEREVRNAGDVGRLEPIVDLNRRQERPTRLAHERGAARQRLPRIPHIVSQEHALALQLARVERPQRELPGAGPERSRKTRPYRP